MSSPVKLTDNWALGMRSDRESVNMPPNSAINLKNIIPGQGNGPAQLRNAWGYAYTGAANFTAASAGATSIPAVFWAPFHSGAQCLLAISEDGAIMRVTIGGVLSLLHATGTAAPVTHQPWFHKDVVYIGNSAGTGYPWTVVTAGTAAVMAGDVPKARTGCSWGEYLILANGGDPAASYALKPRRIWFSDPGLATFTTANNSYQDVPEEVIKVVPVKQGLIAFGYRSTWLIEGTTPPPNSDLTTTDLWPQGAVDQNSIKKWNEYVMYANAEGVFKMDTASNVNLTKRCEVSRDYQSDFEAFTTSWTAAGGIFGDFYILTVCNSTGVEQFTWVFDIAREVAFRFFGFPTKMYAESANPAQASTISSPRDLLFGSNAIANVGRMQPCFSAGASDLSGVDANSVVIDWELFTALYKLDTNDTKRFRRAWISYDWDNTGAGAIKSEYTVTNNPAAGLGGTMVTVTTFPTGRGRQPIFVNDRGRWIALRFSNTTPGTSAIKNISFHGIDIEAHSLEPSKSATV